MLARLLRWIGALFLCLMLCAPSSAQAPAPAPKTPDVARNPPAPQYALAVIATILVLVIICMPSRKRWS